MESDTIAAIATAAGGGVGIIRMSGPDAISLAMRHFHALGDDPARRLPRRLVHGVMVDAEGHALDEGLAVVMPGPRTFTGEDVAELHLHGGALHLARCLAVLVAAGARPAEPGEFSRRAFLNGKIDLTRAEAIADLVAARTDRALAQARQHLRGALWDRAMAAREALLSIRAEIEVNIDFVTEDVPPFDADALAARCERLAADLGRLAATHRLGRLVRDGARVVLAGPPNAGKSSLFNALLEADRAIVTPIPGTTRDTLEESVDMGGVPVVLIDTAGLRETLDPVEALGVARTHDAMAAADLVVVLVPPGEAPPAAHPGLIVRSKADLTGALDPGALAVSATTGQGLDDLRRAIAQRLGVDGAGDELVLARERQRAAVQAAADAVTRAAEALRAGVTPELPAVDLQDAMDALATLVGLTTIEDVLDRLFADFCIGK
ncbi:MAG: tRNA uridine-5-carboxymethylaminomethyl(34) synthesis GTPase MnmE [Deltaproteobacteria bacterium]|nr:tRNA uridine-5-carboxymethylaminomethyl(34) synthesis GTPase MnmE [Deltaproteobacteria bacterium]